MTKQHVSGAFIAITFLCWIKIAYWHFAIEDNLILLWMAAFILPIIVAGIEFTP